MNDSELASLSARIVWGAEGGAGGWEAALPEQEDAPQPTMDPPPVIPGPTVGGALPPSGEVLCRSPSTDGPSGVEAGGFVSKALGKARALVEIGCWGFVCLIGLCGEVAVVKSSNEGGDESEQSKGGPGRGTRRRRHGMDDVRQVVGRSGAFDAPCAGMEQVYREEERGGRPEGASGLRRRGP